MKTPTYQVNLPAAVRFDRTLSAHARLLYGEIKALCDQQGYCWASNQYLARLYQVQKETVSVWLRQLRTSGWIEIRLDAREGNLRKIYLAQPATDTTPSYEKSQGEEGKTTRGLTNSSPPSCDSVFHKPPVLLTNNIIDDNDRVDSDPLTILSIAKESKNEGRKGAGPEIGRNNKAVTPSPPFRSPPLPRDEVQNNGAFARPTVTEVATYMQSQSELCSSVAAAQDQAPRFVNYYQSNGWKVGCHPMQDWQAAARNWLLNTKTYETTQRSYTQYAIENQDESTRKKDYSIPL
ncbi:MAG: helix-turn-helix domain-containing protein [Bacteroidota bacterium]